ncbi:MAG: choice-of-anchor D domain-containing protein, partial [Acetobacteraceae bacterium]
MRRRLVQTSAIVSLAALLAAPAGAAIISLSPDPLDFGDVLVGTTGTQTLTVTDTAGGRNQPVTGNFGTSPRLGGGGGSFTLAAPGSTASADFTWSPTKQGATLGGTVGANGVANNGNTSNPKVDLAGLAVAPIESLGVTGAGDVRIGTSGTSSVTVDNTGNGNLSGAGPVSNLNGSAGSVSTARFAGPGASFSLPDGTGTTIGYTYTPKAHTTNTAKVTVDVSNGSANGKNQPDSTTLKLSGTGVGPVFASSAYAPGSTIDIGTFAPGAGGFVTLTIANISADPGLADLTDLTLLRDRIRGADRADFAVTGFSRGDVLGEGDSLVLQLDFLGAPTDGFYTANLRFVTDEDAALGSKGDVFTY